eukprot:g1006.t1
MWSLEMPPDPKFGDVRGGVLGDAPGLGKTVTMLAHIMRTAGTRPMKPLQCWDEEVVRTNFSRLRRTGVLQIEKCLRGLRRWCDQFFKPSQQIYKKAIAIMRDVVRRANGVENVSLVGLERYFDAQMKEVLMPLGLTRSERRAISNEFSHMLDVLVRCKLDKKARKLMRDPRMQRALSESARYPSGATLIVVPDPLLEHWAFQIREHISLDLFATAFGYGRGRGIIYIDGLGGDITTSTAFGALGSDSVGQIKSRGRTFEELPRSQDLASHLIVITTFRRCRDRSCRNRFLRVRWLRLVVDEGHILGSVVTTDDVRRKIARFLKKFPNESYEYLRQELKEAEERETVAGFLSDVCAERRWILSGTPTTGDVDAEDASARTLRQIQKILRWLRHPKYGIIAGSPDSANARVFAMTLREREEEEEERQVAAAKDAESAWQNEISIPFLRKEAIGLERLTELLKNYLVRHRKEDLQLPKPIFRPHEHDIKRADGMSDEEFNLLVDEVQAEYIVKRLKAARQKETTRDARKPKFVVFSQNDADLTSVTEHIIAKVGTSRVAEFNIADPKIGALAKMELDRFRTDRRKFRKCPVCGFSNHSQSRACDAVLMEVEIVEDGVPTTKQCLADDNVDDATKISFARRRRFLIEADRVIGIIRSHRHHTTHDFAQTADEYKLNSKFWSPNDLLTVNMSTDSNCYPRRPSDATWRQWNVSKCTRLALQNTFDGREWFFGPLPPERSDGSTTVTVRLCKWQKCHRFHSSSSWFKGPKLLDVPLVEGPDDVPILALYNYGSHGLDLSFVTHIFLLEPIHDSALMDQIVSRAYRCGAKGPVEVVTIVVWGEGEMRSSSMKVCDFCFKQDFKSDDSAEAHMKICKSNPRNAGMSGRFSMRSIYASIKPPLKCLVCKGT